MLYVYSSNRLENLADALSSVIAAPTSPDPRAGAAGWFDEWICVQSMGMRTWLKREMALRTGVFAGMRMPFPATVVDALLACLPGADDPAPPRDARRVMAMEIYQMLPSLLDLGAFEPVRSFLGGERDGLSRMAFSIRMAALFDEYGVYRPQMLQAWQREHPGDWQARLWNRLMELRPSSHQGMRMPASAALLSGVPADAFPMRRLCLFGITTLPPAYLELLCAFSEVRDVHLFTLTPSPMYFGDLDRRSVSQKGDIAGNRLVASLGELGRDFQELLTSATESRPRCDVDLHVEPQADRPVTALSLVQSDIYSMVDRRPGNAVAPVLFDAPDDSIRIHSCRSALREVEVLHDQLLRLFEQEPGLGPSDVLVMAPDMDEYAPLIDAVFSPRPGASVRIPFRLSDVRAGEESQTAKAVQALFALADSRLTVQEVFDFLSLAPVRARWELSVEEVDELFEMALAAGIRFGMDAAHREQMGQPAFEENTWRFGLDRLLLGVAVEGQGVRMFGGVLPADGMEGERAALLAKLVAFIDILFAITADFQHAKTVDDWCGAMRRIPGSVTADDGDFSLEAAALRRQLDGLTSDASIAGLAEPVTLAAFRQLFNADPEESASTGFLSGGVTFCRMLPMRSIPFEVVGLLGMNNGIFPRAKTAPGFDLMASRPLRGDRNPRSDDRYLFLESLLSARRRLMIFYVGGDYRDNAPRQPSPLVSTLMDVLDAGIRLLDGAAYSAAITTVHPLKPYSSDYFNDTHPALFSYDASLLSAAIAAQTPKRPPRPFIETPLPGEPVGGFAPLLELLQFFRSPQQFFVERRMGIRLEQPAPFDADREPFALDPLERYQAGTLLLRNALRPDPRPEISAVLTARGTFPLGTPGRIAREALCGQVDIMAACLRRELQGQELSFRRVSLPLTVDGETLEISGRIDGLVAGRRLQFAFSTLRAVHELSAWIQHLMLRIAGPENDRFESVLLARPDDADRVQRVSFSAVPSPGDVLADLVRVYRWGRIMPIPLFIEESYRYVRAVMKNGSAPLPEIHGNRFNPGLLDTPGASLLYGARGPLDPIDGHPEWNFHDLSMRVFAPMLRHRQEEKMPGEAP